MLKYIIVCCLLIMNPVLGSAANPKTGIEQLSILSPHWEGYRNEITRAFQNEYFKKHGKNVEIIWLDQGGSSDILRFIKSEFNKNPNGIKVDLMFGGGVDPYLDLAKNNMLFPYKISSATLQKIPSDFKGVPVYDKQYRWYGTALSGFGILQNDKVVQKLKLPKVATWSDLVNYQIKGWLGSADPRHSGSVHMMYEIILQTYGWEKGWEIITKMGGNIKQFSQSGASTPNEVKNGEIAYGLCIDNYAWSQIAEVGSKNMRFILPSGATVVNPDSIGILKGAPNLPIAKEFVEFVLSDSAQKLLMLPKGSKEGPTSYDIYKMSIVPKIYDELGNRSQIPVNPFKINAVLKYDWQKGSQRYVLINDLLGALIIDNHQELIKAWDKVNMKYKGKAIPAGFTAPPISEKDALTMAQAQWSNSTFRNQKIAEWTNWARNKYTEYSK